jgi:long-subunit fatty acid transport protein
LGAVATLVLCSVFPVQLQAGALYVYEMASPADIGTAGAGLAAKAQNASTVFTNPAGMTRFDHPELHKFKTDGLKLGGFGVNKVKLTGDVYDLRNVADFAGVYGVAEAGATLGNASTSTSRA